MALTKLLKIILQENRFVQKSSCMDDNLQNYEALAFLIIFLEDEEIILLFNYSSSLNIGQVMIDSCNTCVSDVVKSRKKLTSRVQYVVFAKYDVTCFYS